MDIKDFKDKRVTIMGLGLHGGGTGAAKFLSSAGAKVLVTDLRKKEELLSAIKELRGHKIEFILGQHRSEDFFNTDLVIQNPAVPNNSKYLQIARENKVPIDTDMGIFVELCEAPIIGVTGTKGKSTTATLIEKLLKNKYKDIILAGNIRVSPLLYLGKIRPDTMVILEFSSWQLEGLARHKKSPHISVITNIMPDHLNRYKNFDDYVQAKKNIYKFQKKNDFLIVNYDDPILKSIKDAKANLIFFSTVSPDFDEGVHIKRGLIYLNNEMIMDIKEIRVKGQHNLNNVAASIAVAGIHNIPLKSIRKTLSEFEGIPDRLEFIQQVNGVKFYNDTTATTPEAAIAALKTLKDQYQNANLILITGGSDKKLTFDELAKKILKYASAVIFLKGSATDKIKESLSNAGHMNDKVLTDEFNNMENAVKKAYEVSQPGDIVVLSPASASFELFKNEFDRGQQFINAVQNL